MGSFVDFCLGPHLESTGKIKAFKLNPSPAASYWKGREGNPSMQRIYGYAFFTKEELEQHLHRVEEAKRRDHRKLGRELDLFSISEDTGAGLVLWHPKGGFIRKQIEDFWRDQASGAASSGTISYSTLIRPAAAWSASTGVPGGRSTRSPEGDACSRAAWRARAERLVRYSARICVAARTRHR